MGVDAPRPRCVAIISTGRQCVRDAVFDGLCINHYVASHGRGVHRIV